MMALAFQLYVGFVLLQGAYMKSIQNTTDHAISFASLKSAVDRLEERMENMIVIQAQGQANAYRPISFFVRLSQPITLNKNSIVKFHEISVNEGNHFNSGDGIFVAPVSGIYQFSWTTLTSSNKLVETELRVDNIVKETLHIALNSAGNISGSKVVLCKVGKGDHVWIQTSHVYETNYFLVANAARSSFTGMLIHEL